MPASLAGSVVEAVSARDQMRGFSSPSSSASRDTGLVGRDEDRVELEYVVSPILQSFSDNFSSLSERSSSPSSSSSVRFRGSQVILFSFFSRLRALANHVETWVSVILVMIASMIFSPLVGYGFFLCSFSQAFSVFVDSRVAFFLLAASS